MEFVVDKVAGEGARIFPRTSVSPANLHSTNFSTITITYHPGLVQKASSGRSTQSPTAQIKKNNNTRKKSENKKCSWYLRQLFSNIFSFFVCHHSTVWWRDWALVTQMSAIVRMKSKLGQ
jgi:hypothetical protein